MLWNISVVLCWQFFLVLLTVVTGGKSSLVLWTWRIKEFNRKSSSIRSMVYKSILFVREVVSKEVELSTEREEILLLLDRPFLELNHRSLHRPATGLKVMVTLLLVSLPFRLLSTHSLGNFLSRQVTITIHQECHQLKMNWSRLNSTWSVFRRLPKHTRSTSIKPRLPRLVPPYSFVSTPSEEDVFFDQHCKLYCFDGGISKEHGKLKLHRNLSTKKVRLLMPRDLVNILFLNLKTISSSFYLSYFRIQKCASIILSL